MSIAGQLQLSSRTPRVTVEEILNPYCCASIMATLLYVIYLIQGVSTGPLVSYIVLKAPYLTEITLQMFSNLPVTDLPRKGKVTFCSILRNVHVKTQSWNRSPF